MLACEHDVLHERLEVVEELAVVVQRPDESLDARLVLLIRLEPVRRALAFAQRFLEVELEALRDDRPRADERLPHEVFLVRVVHAAGQLPPAPHVRGPAVVHARERADACTNVAGTLRVMRL